MSTPRVAFVIPRANGSMTSYEGHLVYYQGEPWCYPDDAALDQNPTLAGALLLDSTHLELDDDSPPDAPLYRYHGAIPIPHSGSETPQSIPGRFQGK